MIKSQYFSKVSCQNFVNRSKGGFETSSKVYYYFGQTFCTIHFVSRLVLESKDDCCNIYLQIFPPFKFYYNLCVSQCYYSTFSDAKITKNHCCYKVMSSKRRLYQFLSRKPYLSTQLSLCMKLCMICFRTQCLQIKTFDKSRMRLRMNAQLIHVVAVITLLLCKLLYKLFVKSHVKVLLGQLHNSTIWIGFSTVYSTRCHKGFGHNL